MATVSSYGFFHWIGRGWGFGLQKCGSYAANKTELKTIEMFWNIRTYPCRILNGENSLTDRKTDFELMLYVLQKPLEYIRSYWKHKHRDYFEQMESYLGRYNIIRFLYSAANKLYFNIMFFYVWIIIKKTVICLPLNIIYLHSQILFNKNRF